jgi:beta-ribofuranosylaminobenzene 5'-phosphate synthase
MMEPRLQSIGSAPRRPVPERQAVSVTAPARLHVGFLDLHGGLGRRFGSIGLTLEGIGTSLRVEPAAETSASGPDAERALAAVRRLSEAWRIPPVRIDLAGAIPAHVGLGSGTQLRLAVGIGLARVFDMDAGTAEVARLLDRGARSGIGLGAFEQGGLLVDGGRSEDDAVPPIVARLPFPEDWRILLLLDQARHGLHGAAEIQAFARLPPFPEDLAAHLCRLTLMQLLPGVALADLANAGRALGEIQRAVGDHFAPAQGGRFASPAVAEALGWLASEGIEGVGQSSWGPTGFALVEDREAARRLEAGMKRRCARARDLRIVIAKGRNQGAEIVAGALARFPAAE